MEDCVVEDESVRASGCDVVRQEGEVLMAREE